ncbi:unnamed protein product [Orchesella dallaii]|uniref:Uncharacterized protein n=1 Tax=Orchesella dallaii TaxID=48710 RepID=A0ABP1RPJ7_9HEXA
MGSRCLRRSTNKIEVPLGGEISQEDLVSKAPTRDQNTPEGESGAAWNSPKQIPKEKVIMSDSYSEILEGSFDSILNGGGEKLHSVLKHEVGVVQGARRLKTVQDDPNWIESSEADGYDDTGTKVIKIEGRILKSQRVLEKKHSQIENKSMKLLFNWFCLQNRIPLLSSSNEQDRSGGGRRSKSRSKAPTGDQNTPGGDVGAEADLNSHRKSQRTGKKGSTVGGAGGGKRPHRQSSTSEPDSARSLQVIESSEQIVSSSAEVSTEINDRNRKRKSRRHEKFENEEQTTNRAKTFKLNEHGKVPADEIFSSSTNLVQNHRKKSYGNESSSRRKKSKRKHDHVIETSDIFSIPTSSVSQSFQEKVRTGKSVHIEEPGGRESLSANPTKNKQVKEYRRRSSYRKKLKSRKTLLQREDPFLIINLSEISKIVRTERGNEWLEWTSSEDEAQDQDEDEQEHPISFPSTPSAPSSPGDYVLYQAHNLLEPTTLFPYFVDCYQVNFTQDNCGNPGVALPSLSNFAVKISPPQIQLIAVNQNPDFDENDYRMFCCYKYAWSSENEVKVCNMRSKAELIRFCRLKSTWYRFFNASAASLRKLRMAGSGKRDDLGVGVPYDDPVRMSWTKCLCMSNATECKKVDPDWGSGTSTIRPPTKKPITTTTTLQPGTPGKPSCVDLPDLPSVTNKYFIKCPIPSKAGLWKDLPFIAHPFIFQKVKNGQHSSFKLHLKLKPTCNPDAEGNPLPRDTVDDSLQNGEVVYDCDENHGHHFSRDTNSYFEDECSNPILFYNTIWTPSKQRIRVVKLSESRVACCINYPLQNVPLSRKQALVCNNVEDVSFKCGNKTDNIREYCLSSFMKKWIQLDYNKRDRLESDKMVVKCMCNQLEYVQKTNTGLVNDRACLNYINSLM